MLKQRLQEDMKSAMRAKETVRLDAIRMLMAAIKQREVDERITLTDADIHVAINKMIKQRRESATQFRNANRLELADKEEQEIGFLTQYLPTQLTETELNALISEAIQSSGANSIKEMGAVMSFIREKAQGRVDMAVVSAKIKERLA